MDKTTFDSMLEKYADVTVKVGLNLRAGQRLLVHADLASAPFVRKVAEAAYKSGARLVDVDWGDEAVSRIRMERSDANNLAEIPDYILSRFEDYFSHGDAQLAIFSSNPDLMDGIDPERISISRKAGMEKLGKPLSKYENARNWCIVATAAPDWAKKVFPNGSVEVAQEKLWEAIFKACRIDTADPVAEWKQHTARLEKYKDYLDTKHYAALHYLAPGTDLTIGLPDAHQWGGAQETFNNGITNTVNVPTEEVFTAAHMHKVDGVVKATYPLNLGGVLIDDFSVTFKDGRAVNVSAKKGEADLRKLIESDENAARLGEVALVPNSSPISQSGILFYNTLFDENASCHIALGRAIRTSIKGGAEMTDEEFMAHDANFSLIHTDFMIGSGEINIDGLTADGAREPVMRNGEWTFTP